MEKEQQRERERETHNNKEKKFRKRIWKFSLEGRERERWFGIGRDGRKKNGHE